MPESRVVLDGKVSGSDGMWGPFTGSSSACYEFVGSHPETAISHVYRSPFPRSSSVVNLRLAKLGEASRKAAGALFMTRPRGFFAVGRVPMHFDGKDPPGIGTGVPGLNISVLRLSEPGPRTVLAEYDGERIAMRTWPASENRIAGAEFHY